MNRHYPFTLSPLPYSYEALQPQIDAQTLHFHHDRHLQTYVDNLNKALEGYPEFYDWSLQKLLTQCDRLPEKIRIPVKNNAGGVYNHELYFKTMAAPENGTKPSPELLLAIEKCFCSFDLWKKAMKEAGLTQFGSGWAWLVKDEYNDLFVMKTLNQDTPVSTGVTPLLLVDVWEHAYYLQYQNRRADYLENWFSLINWDAVNEAFSK